MITHSWRLNPLSCWPINQLISTNLSSWIAWLINQPINLVIVSCTCCTLPQFNGIPSITKVAPQHCVWPNSSVADEPRQAACECRCDCEHDGVWQAGAALAPPQVLVSENHGDVVYAGICNFENIWLYNNRLFRVVESLYIICFYATYGNRHCSISISSQQCQWFLAGQWLMVGQNSRSNPIGIYQLQLSGQGWILLQNSQPVGGF